MKDYLKELTQKKYFLPIIIFGLVFIFLGVYISIFQPSPNQRVSIFPTQSPSPLLNTSPAPSASIEEQFKREDQKQSAFAKFQADVATNFPWHDKLPIKDSDYFVYFDVEKKSFVGLLYPVDSSKNQLTSQVIIMKGKIKKSLTDLGINFTSYKFIWIIKPEAKLATGEDALPIEKRPGLQKTERFNNGVTKYTFTSSNQTRPNIITVDKSGSIIFQRLLTGFPNPPQITDYTETYNSPPWVFKGSVTYGSIVQTYIYPDLGIAFIANPQTGEVFEQHLFIPTKVEDYVNKYGDDIPAQP